MQMYIGVHIPLQLCLLLPLKLVMELYGVVGVSLGRDVKTCLRHQPRARGVKVTKAAQNVSHYCEERASQSDREDAL